ncbi:Complement receptor type 2, partial [Acanthisitta chloris]
CAPPPGIANGEHSGMNQDVYVYGDTVTYHCHTVRGGEIPLSLVGDASIFCTTTDGVNGVWSSPAPQCKVVVCEYPRVDHGKLLTRSSDYTYGVTVLFSCNFRFTMQGSETSMCKEDGSWDPPPPTCQRTCGPAPGISNGQHSGLGVKNFPYGANVTYTCLEGLSLIGNKSIYC